MLKDLQKRERIKLPKMLKNYEGGEFDFSYSGLKTAVINYVHNETERGNEINKADVANSFQCSAIDVLVEKALSASKKYGFNNLYNKIAAIIATMINTAINNSLTFSFFLFAL